MGSLSFTIPRFERPIPDILARIPRQFREQAEKGFAVLAGVGQQNYAVILQARLANILILIGIASALLFDSGKVPHVFVGTIGVIAGVATIALYFWNQYHIEAKKEANGAEIKTEAEVKPVVESKPEVAVVRRNTAATNLEALKAREKAWKSAAEGFELAVWDTKLCDARMIDAYRRELAAHHWLVYYDVHQARTLRWHVPKDASLKLMQPEVELSPKEVAACAVQIMRYLALDEDLKGWEYVFDPKGLRVSVKKAHSIRPEPISQEDFDFEPTASLAS
jgi:hypothetical protein